VLANGVFAGAEIAILSIRKSRLAELADGGSRAVKAIVALRSNPERFLATVQIGITVVGTAAAAYGGANVADTFAETVKDVPYVGPYASQFGVTVVVVLLAFFQLVVGELVPKSLALRYAETYARAVARPLSGVAWLAAPVVSFLTGASNLLLRLFGDKTTFTEARLSPEELRLMVDEAARTGSLDPRAGEIASRALDFGTLSAWDCMVPRGAVVGLARHAPGEVVSRVMLEESHSRVPIYEGTIDHIIGYVTAKDVLAMSLQGSLLILEDLIRPAYFVPESMPAVDLLHELQKRRMPIAIVVDELGSTAGIVTMEDLVEELVGEIFSEHDKAPEDMVVQEAGGVARVQAVMPIRDVNRALGLDLPEEDDFTTVAGLVLSLAGRIPLAGMVLRTEAGHQIEVVEATPRRVRVVRIRPATRPTAEDAPT
jgi:putative hemolysin